MRLTRSHPVSRLLRSGHSMKSAWRLYKGGRSRRRGTHRRRNRARPGGKTGYRFSGTSYRPRRRRLAGHRAWALSSFRKNRGRRRARRNGGFALGSNPIIVSNRRGRRHRRGRRNAGLVRFFNPNLGAVTQAPRRILGYLKESVSVGNLKKGAVTVGVIAAAWGLPARFLPQHDEGVKGLGLTLGAGAVTAVTASILMPALVPVVVGATAVAVLLKSAFMYGRQWLFPNFQGLGAFLTVPMSGMGQIPPSLIAGGMGSFLETKGQFTSAGPVRSAALGNVLGGSAGGENFSTFS